MLKWLILLTPIFSFCQTSVDTLSAAAQRTNFAVGGIYGLTREGHIYSMGFNLNYNANGGSLPADMVRLDLNAHSYTTKSIPQSVSAASMFWRFSKDKWHRDVFGLNSNRDIYVADLKDSIKITNVGKFATGELAYTIQAGRDSLMYVGGSSGPYSLLWGILNDTTFVEKPAIDDVGGYVLSVMGDTGNYITAMTGQNPYKMWVVDKATGTYKKLLATQETLFNTGVKTTGVFYQDAIGQYYKVTDTVVTPISVDQAAGAPINFRDINVDYEQVAGLPVLSNSFYDEVKQKYYWTVNNVADSMAYTSTFNRSEIRRIFQDKYNTNILYYVGDYYGFWYKYNKTTQVSTALGFIGFNTFDALQTSPTKMYICGYPSAQLVEWDMSQLWTAETFANGAVRHLSTTTNPKLIGYWRSNTPAGFHEPNKLILCNGKIFSGGNEIRTGATCSIGGYDTLTHAFWGLNRDSIYGLNYSDIAPYGKYVLFSTNSTGNVGTAKLFWYNSESRTLADSLYFGFENYGNLYVIGDFMIGIAPTRLYKVNLSTKQLVYNSIITGGTITGSQMMDDWIIGIRTTGTVVIPKDFWPTRVIGDTKYTPDGNGNYYALYNNQGQAFQILKKNGVTTYTVNPETAEGKQKILIERLR